MSILQENTLLLLMKYLYALLFISLLSCERPEIEQPAEFPSTLYLSRISIKSKVRLYTAKKEITDQAIIDRFVESNGGFRLKDSSVVSDEYIKFISPDSAEMVNSSSSFLITKNDKQLLFKSTKKQIVTQGQMKSSFNMLKYRSEFEPVWDNKFSTYNMMVGYGNYSELSMSVFEYLRVWWTTSFDSLFFQHPDLYKASSYGKTLNEFDESYVNSIGKADTLAIREYFYLMKKR
ncbi:hypothetical protein [Dyadobacter sandarakinus]|uniref:Uncharacterized protein n=1 Tax=Dyadobacter sandarakinus TaxID=2747268 RepID=A0ABX7I3U6_9BACT|nr:hypothetical protein [Dyadobacter sandarakinus]QRR00754.1 hypothetical protein HWI92_07465 [Dyadobacter sandarakinus]